MPLYEYKCNRCGAVFEKLQKFSDEPLEVHDVCGGPVERLVSAPTFQFKGSGWYVTDYARGGNGGRGNGKKSETDASKPAAKSEPAKPSETTSKPDTTSKS
jgi:putative FmdB family regulatory protein